MDCHAGNPCGYQSDPMASIDSPMIRGILQGSWEKKKLNVDARNIILTKQNVSASCYGVFDKFTYKKGAEDVDYEYYLRFTLLLNDMNFYKMAFGAVQAELQVLNTLPANGANLTPCCSKTSFSHQSQCCYQADDLDGYDSDCDELNAAKIALIGPSLKEMDQMTLTGETSVPPLDPSHSSTTVIVEVPKELPTVSCLVKDKNHCHNAITEGRGGLKHTKALFFEMKSFRVFELEETELVKKKDFVDKETYDKLCKCFTNLEKHCITLEADSQLNQEIFQQENSVLNQNAPSFSQLFELSELKAQSQAKDTVIVKLKEQIKSLKGNGEDSSVKLDMDEIETLNIELEHRVTKLVTENEHLKQTYKQLYDSIKPKRVQSKEQCDALIKQVNIKSGEISDLNAKLQEQGLVIAALKNELRKLKGKAIDNKETVTHSVDPNVSKDNMEPITPKLLNKRTAHSSYIKHTQEEALVLRDIVEHVKANYPQDPLLESAFRYTKVIQDLLSHISRSCPSVNNCGSQLIEVIPRKKDKKVRFAESLTSTENTKPASTSNIVSNKRVLHSTGVRLSTSASGSQPSGNTKNDRILQTPSSNSKNKVEAHPRNVKSSSKKHKSKKDSWKPTGKVFTQIGYIWR
ncbi:hypothetical protein Tco_0962644, partial [Tanacetum coccineum]